MLGAQTRSGERLDKVLLATKFVTRQEIAAILAVIWGISYADLLRMPPQAELASSFPADEMAHDGWVPLAENGVELLVATSERPSDARRDHILGLYNRTGRTQARTISFIATTDWDIQVTIQALFRHNLMHDAAYGLSDRSPMLSARLGLVLWQKLAPFAILGAIGIGCLFNLYVTFAGLIMAFSVVFFAAVIFKVTTSVLSVVHRSRIITNITDRVPDDELPLYTVLIPIYKEANIVKELIGHLQALDYPPEKVEVLLLLEEDDQETIDAVERVHPADNIRPIIVPAGQPQTKPRACNVGLFFARGKYLVIYDAEDRPEPDQLRKALNAFLAGPETMVCVQARLNYFNHNENLLTRMFTLEYSYWFDYMLPGLDRLRLPIPLGGTSNHFRVDRLRALGGWDAFNVTEDADLGLRASATGFSVGIIDSTTFEEACSKLGPWIRQRTRWIKGYMQTVGVHSRRPFSFASNAGLRGVFGFLLLIAGTPFTFLMAPILWLLTLCWMLKFPPILEITHPIPAAFNTVGTFSFILGNVAMIFLNALAVERRRLWYLLPYSLLAPLYWLLHSYAAWRALYQVIRDPFVWEKTPHGISSMTDVKPATAPDGLVPDGQ